MFLALVKLETLWVGRPVEVGWIVVNLCWGWAGWGLDIESRDMSLVVEGAPTATPANGLGLLVLFISKVD